VARILAARGVRQYRQKKHGAAAPLSPSGDCLVSGVDQVSNRRTQTMIRRQFPASGTTHGVTLEFSRSF